MRVIRNALLQDQCGPVLRSPQGDDREQLMTRFVALAMDGGYPLAHSPLGLIPTESHPSSLIMGKSLHLSEPQMLH